MFFFLLSFRVTVRSGTRDRGAQRDGNKIKTSKYQPRLVSKERQKEKLCRAHGLSNIPQKYVHSASSCELTATILRTSRLPFLTDKQSDVPGAKLRSLEKEERCRKSYCRLLYSNAANFRCFQRYVIHRRPFPPSHPLLHPCRSNAKQLFALQRELLRDSK